MNKLSEKTNITITGILKDIEYTNYGIVLKLVSPWDKNGENGYSTQVKCTSRKVVDTLTKLLDKPFSQRPAIDLPVVVFAQQITKRDTGELKCFPTFSIPSDYSL